MTANVLITGGTGFVGTWMERTEPEGVDVYYLSHNGYCQRFWWQDKMHKWDYIVHLANVCPDYVLDCAMRHNARLLYCSSGAAYDQTGEYADNKRRWEQECIQSGVDVVIARLFTFFGDGLDDGKAIVQFVRAAREGRPLEIWGDGSTVRSYMSGRDMGRLMWAVLLRGKSGEIYDIGSDKPVTMLELAQMVVKYYRPAPILIRGGAEKNPYYMPRDTAKAKNLLDTS